jgi:hypothetical protein
MDGLSLIVGGTLGILAGWAFSNASYRQRDGAGRKSKKVTMITKEIALQQDEARHRLEYSLVDFVQGFLLNVLGVCIIIAMGMILLGSLF